MARENTLFLCGDVMTGRGIDQVMPHSVDPAIRERIVTSATDYVKLAEKVNGPINKPVDPAYPWGEAAVEWQKHSPELKIVNLETAVTVSSDRAVKGINYRMHPANVDCLLSAGFDCCVLANNHVLDWSQQGLLETLAVLRPELAITGAGETLERARAPAVLHTASNRILVFSAGTGSSGIPPQWGATDSQPGVWLLNDLTADTVSQVAEFIGSFRKPGDIVIFSIHWGPNWVRRIPGAHRQFARALIDSGLVDLIHGHSSHHPIGMEVYRGRLILYGCGDFLNDYEGILRYSKYRNDLCMMYFPTLGSDGRLLDCRMVAMQIRNFRLWRATPRDTNWLARKVSRSSPRLRTRVSKAPDGDLVLHW